MYLQLQQDFNNMSITSPGGLSTGINNQHPQRSNQRNQQNNSNFIKLQSCISQVNSALNTNPDNETKQTGDSSSCNQPALGQPSYFKKQVALKDSSNMGNSHDNVNQDTGSPYDKQLEEHAQSVLKQIQLEDYSDDDDLFNTGKSTQANLVESQEEE